MSGRSPLPDATTAWPAHTLTSPCCLHRLHSVTSLHYRRRLESIIIRSTASSTSVSCQAQIPVRSLHCITLALILTRHVHNPTLVGQRCEHIIYCPRPKPLGVEGSVLEAMSAMPGCLRSDGRPRYWKESVPMHSDTAALTFNHSYRKIACLAAHCVGAHPYGAVHTLSLARSTSLHYATIGFAGGAPLHYVALARRTCWLSHFCRQSDIAMLMTFFPHWHLPPPSQTISCVRGFGWHPSHLPHKRYRACKMKQGSACHTSF